MTRRQRARRPPRRSPIQSVRRRLLVVCEGQNTEPQYIRGYEREVRNATVNVEISRQTGEPRKVVEIAKEMSRAAQEGDYDEVWCVFDRDEHPRFNEAVDMAVGNGFELAVSNPCFELWLLLHFRENPGPQHRHTLQTMMSSFVHSYDKTIDFAQFVAGLPDAEVRAKRLDEAADRMDEVGRNPTTGMYALTRSIRRDSDT